MNARNLATLGLFALLLAPLVAAVIPSEEAIDSASAYLRQGEQASIVSRPYLIDGRQYFVIYFHPQTNQQAKNLVIVVDADTGELVEDETTLRKVYTFDNKLSFLQQFVSDKKLSFQDMRASIESGKASREQAEDSLDQVETNLRDTDENIATVQTTFSQFILSIEQLTDEVDSGVESQDLFEREYSNIALEGLTTRYNSTFKTLVTVLKNGEDYQRAVVNKSNELTQKGIDQNKFKPGLQAAFNVGLEKFPSRTSFESAFAEFNGINSVQSQRQVNDSINSYLYRKDKVDSDNAVESVRASVDEILRKKSEVVECTPIANLEKYWQNALRSQEANEFDYVKGNVTLVENELNKVKTELDKCTGPATPQQTPSDNTNLFIGVILLLLVGYFAWKYMQKKKEGTEEQPQAPAGKGNLFG